MTTAEPNDELPTASIGAQTTKGPLPPPQGWGADELTKFFDSARINQYATFSRKRPIYAKLSAIDAIFCHVGKEMVDPKDPLSAMLMYRSHSAFRAACGVALSTQNADAYPLIRSSLEYAGYARLIHGNESLGKVWLGRHQDDTSRQRTRKEFTQANVRNCIEKDDAELAENYDELYQHCIDFGAHPNERAITSNLTISKNESQTLFTQAYLGGDSIALNFLLKTLAQAGYTELLIFKPIFHEKFSRPEVIDELQKVRQGLSYPFRGLDAPSRLTHQIL
ncbi:MAG: hypothetical protein FJX46_03200 [Alphaproteobacteria bacterium]|nr:hypothetical protein [Alphaproteobacteria bacterium]